MIEKVLLTICTLMIVGHSLEVTAQSNDTIKIMTWNIRLDIPDDGINQWKLRNESLCNEIIQQAPGILGVQEALINQMIDMRKLLVGYKSIGVGRDDGKKEGEFSAIFYHKSSYKKIRSGTFWLSQTPNVAGSRGWDAACNRIVTWAEFKDKHSGKHFIVFNTHFDHLGDTARVESAKLIHKKLKELANKLPVILTGDLNVTSKDRAYRIITNPENEYVLVNSRSRALKKNGPEFSWVSFDPEFKEPTLIDFIFTTYDFNILSSTILDFRSKGRYLSDHLPVISVMELGNEKIK
ncbi:MAG: endonuclease/exonuclease/phosphatase family protein [Omnitrophica WOR_2 bacterium]